jgi:CBS domain-containing protein
MKVENLMSREVQACRAEDTLNHAAQLMWEHDCGAIPVVDSLGREIGILTDRDICMAAYTRGLPLEAIRVCETMGCAVYTCRPEDTLSAALIRMRDHKVRRLPVVDQQDRLVGILSFNDIVREVANESQPAAKAEVLATAAAICEPRKGHVELAAMKREPQSVRPSSKREPLVARQADLQC